MRIARRVPLLCVLYIFSHKFYNLFIIYIPLWEALRPLFVSAVLLFGSFSTRLGSRFALISKSNRCWQIAPNNSTRSWWWLAMFNAFFFLFAVPQGIFPSSILPFATSQLKTDSSSPPPFEQSPLNGKYATGELGNGLFSPPSTVTPRRMLMS